MTNLRSVRALLLTLSIILTSLNQLCAQANVDINGLDANSEDLKQKLEVVVRNFVSKFDTAGSLCRKIDFTGVDISPAAQESISRIWNYSPFICADSVVSVQYIWAIDGCQIRSIPVRLKANNEQLFAAVDISSASEITDFYFTFDNYQYNQLVSSPNKSVLDLQRRITIVKFLEKLRTAYNIRDLSYIFETILQSGEQLSMLGSGSSKQYDISMAGECVFDGFGALLTSISTNEFMCTRKHNILHFKDVHIVQHPVINDILGVTFRLTWSDSDYESDCWLFFALEVFKEELICYISAWHPYVLNGVIFPRSEVVQLGNFEIG